MVKNLVYGPRNDTALFALVIVGEAFHRKGLASPGLTVGNDGCVESFEDALHRRLGRIFKYLFLRWVLVVDVVEGELMRNVVPLILKILLELIGAANYGLVYILVLVDADLFFIGRNLDCWDKLSVVNFSFEWGSASDDHFEILICRDGVADSSLVKWGFLAIPKISKKLFSGS